MNHGPHKNTRRARREIHPTLGNQHRQRTRHISKPKKSTSAATAKHCTALTPKRKTTPAPCPPPKAARPSSWWSMSARSSSSFLNSAAPAATTFPFLIRAVTKSSCKTCATKKSATACAKFGPTPWRWTQPRQRPSHPRSGPTTGHRGQKPGGRWTPRSPSRRLPDPLPVQHVCRRRGPAARQ